MKTETISKRNEMRLKKAIMTIDNERTGYVSFRNHNLIRSFFEDMNKLSFNKNFNGDPYNWASYIDFRYNNNDYRISYVRANNGDINWYSYNSDFGFNCLIKSLN